LLVSRRRRPCCVGLLLLRSIRWAVYCPRFGGFFAESFDEPELSIVVGSSSDSVFQSAFPGYPGEVILEQEGIPVADGADGSVEVLCPERPAPVTAIGTLPPEELGVLLELDVEAWEPELPDPPGHFLFREFSSLAHEKLLKAIFSH
jgi:hypothetical protein